MQITRETDYAIRCILHLAQKPDRLTVIDEIAKAGAIPKSFLSKILQKLTRAHIVRSHRGLKGGFQLAKRAKEISIFDVIEAIEGPLAMNICALDKKMCDFSNTCAVHPIWVEIREEFKKILKRYHFARLTPRQ